MKQLLTSLAILLVTLTSFAQAPNRISYQAEVRNSGNNLIVNQLVGIRISILQGSNVGASVYTETHTPTTNANGLVSLQIGGGTIVSGTFASINWGNGPYFLKTETDPAGGTNYSITGTNQLLSVPYALFSNASNNGVPSGGSEGQVLTNCGGVAIWTTGGICPGSITALACSTASNTGTLTQGIAAASVSSTIAYTGGNGGLHNGQTVTSTGVTGLTATLAAGSFASGAGTLTYTITGTPASGGTANFALNIGGQTCTLAITVAAPIGTLTALTCASATNSGSLTLAVAASGVSSSVPYTGGNGGTHSGQTVTSTGVTGLTATLAAGNFAIGAGSLIYTITGTPATSGTASFALNIGGKTCTLTRTVALPVGTIAALSCSTATNAGTLGQGVAAASVSSTVPYTGGNGGTHTGQTVTSTGVTGLTATRAAANFATGSGTLVYTITGTPAASGTASFALNIGGQTCTLTRTVLASASITALNCSTATNNGTLGQGVAAASVSSSVSYIGGNGGYRGSQTFTSTGVTGLTATCAAGTLANGSGNLTFTITGTPASSGTASFALNIGGQTCTLNRTVLPSASITALSCSTATNNGTLTQGIAAASVNSSVPYTGGNGGYRGAQTFTSTGVTGLTASCAAGTLATGAGSLTFTITGTPSSSGTASFALNIGGQTCTLTRTVNPPAGTITALSCSTATNTGTLTQGIAATSVSSSVPYTGGNGGTYSAQTITSTGVTGLTANLSAGTLLSGAGSLTFTITGTPATSGTASFALIIGGQTCTLTRIVALPVGIITALSCSNATNSGILTQGIAASSVSSSVPYTGGNGGTYTAQTITSTGVTGFTATRTAGTLASGSGSISYTITGTPATSGTASFALNIGGQTCTLTRTVDLPVGTITALSCSTATNNGTLGQGVAAASVSSSVPYTGGNGGYRGAQTFTSTGVTGLTATCAAGTLANGSGNLTFTITGTPASSGTASFALNIGGQTCTLTRTVLPTASITALSCSTATNNGTLTQGIAAASVNSSVPYTGGNGGYRAAQTFTSTGVTGLTATCAAGTLATGAGSLTLTITGTPASNGTASFALNIGGQSCTLTRTVNPPAGTITALSCSTATNTGTLTQGIAAASVSSSVPYTGGNGGTYSSQTITSTGVTGLTATLSAGTLLSGAGSLTYNITGTPASSGTASFTLNIGGQTCILTRTVNILGLAHSCGATNIHNPAKTYGTMTDQQGNVYKTILIGTQEWMAENLKTSIYNDGTPIPNVTSNAQWSSTTSGAWVYYNNDSQYDCPYGKLYNWYTATDSRLCPAGWHVPSYEEWMTITNYLGGVPIAGGKMKTSGTQYWNSPNTDATNETGFSGLPGGLRDIDGTFNLNADLILGNGGFWWSSSLVNGGPLCTIMGYNYSALTQANGSNETRLGQSIRCLKDATPQQGSINNIDCGNATNNGTLTQGIAAASVSSNVPYTGGNGGVYIAQTVTSTGVTGLTANLAAGTLLSGAGSLTYTITGTPASSGTASFALSIGGQTCTLTRTVALPVGTITALSCSTATNTGTLTQGIAAASVSSSVPYTGGNSGTYTAQTITSTGVTGLTATLTAGTLLSGAGSLIYTITGTPASSGTASFALNIGGQTCTLTRTVSLPAGSITALTCSTASNTGTLTQGVAATSVSSSVPYTGGNGGTYTAQTVTSTGVTGLTATLTAGNLLNGAGSLTYTITGTPANSGTASFTIGVGGQTCTLTFTVNTSGSGPLNIETALIPAGTFTMGSPTTEPERDAIDEAQHQVTLIAYRMSKYEISNAQFAAFLNAKSIGSNGLYALGAYPTQVLIYANASYGLTWTGTQWQPVAGKENFPVVNVTWYGATEFATYAGGRLPTEAEWEYACRGNTITAFSTGACLNNTQANYRWDLPLTGCSNTSTAYPNQTQAVNSYSPNAFGLYNMHGNVHEWCSDWYGAYSTTAQTNPTGASSGSNRVRRGGSWDYNAQSCRSAYRISSPPGNYGGILGFRLSFAP